MRFRIGRAKVKISFLFFAMLTLLFVVDKKQIAVITLACSLLHEIGHICAIFLFGDQPDEIALGIFGVRIRQNKHILSNYQQTIVVLAGPLVNIILFVLFFVVNLIFANEVLLIVSAVNFVIGAFNLLPVLPLDGGRILIAILGMFLPDEIVCKIMRLISVGLLLLIIIAGIALIAETGANISLLATGIYISALCVKSIRI